MDMKKTAIATAAGFVLQMATNYLLHGVILMNSYADTAELWRTDDGMAQRRWILFVGTFIFVLGAVLIYQRGAERKSPVGQGIRFGILLALVSTVPASLFEYVTTPMPHRLAFHWIIGEGVQCLLLGLLTAFICQPKDSAA
ncbi:MAG TPA: hypothetical protein VIH72_11505 [Candidatus Acidoferrales bacterium]|jgi:hypothetical protein